MLLQSLSLSHFRNFAKVMFEFHPAITFIVGPNSVGKTNTLESIFFIMTGSGIKEEKQEELLQFAEPVTIIKSTCKDGQDTISFDCILERSESGVVKKYFINQVPKSSYAYNQQTIPVVFFAPQRIEHLTRSPSSRRRLIDSIIGKYDPLYKKHLNSYSTSLTKRNKILERGGSQEYPRQQLQFWDDYLLQHATYVTAARKTFVEMINTKKMVPSLEFSVAYEPNIFSHDRLAETFEKQIRYRSTVIGPQRDDVDILFKKTEDAQKEQSVLTYGSRSQQRLALLWINFFELDIYKEKLDRNPLLLLDDVFSELDEQNKELLLHVITSYQTIITTNDGTIARHAPEEHGVITLK